MCSPTFLEANLSAFFPTGALHSQATIFTMPAVANLRQHSRYWSTRFDIEGGDEYLSELPRLCPFGYRCAISVARVHNQFRLQAGRSPAMIVDSLPKKRHTP